MKKRILSIASILIGLSVMSCEQCEVDPVVEIDPIKRENKIKRITLRYEFAPSGQAFEDTYDLIYNSSSKVTKIIGRLHENQSRQIDFEYQNNKLTSRTDRFNNNPFYYKYEFQYGDSKNPDRVTSFIDQGRKHVLNYSEDGKTYHWTQENNTPFQVSKQGEKTTFKESSSYTEYVLKGNTLSYKITLDSQTSLQKIQYTTIPLPLDYYVWDLMTEGVPLQNDLPHKPNVGQRDYLPSMYIRGEVGGIQYEYEKDKSGKLIKMIEHRVNSDGQIDNWYKKIYTLSY